MNCINCDDFITQDAYSFDFCCEECEHFNKQQEKEVENEQ
jgi:hypothetical protein